MSLLARSLEQKAAPTRGISTPSEGFQMVNGRLVAYKDNQQNYLVNGYMANDVIFSIIKLITDKIRIAPWGMYKVEDEQAYKQLIAIKAKKEWTAKDYTTALNLQRKALTPATNAGKWGDLMKWANEDTSMSDFIANAATYKLCTGNDYIFGDPLKGGLNAGVPYELQLLPSQYTNIYATDRFPSRVTGYQVTTWPDATFAPDQILHEKFFNPEWDVNGSQLYGMSPLKAALMRLKKSNESTKAEAATFQNEGIKGLMFMKNQVGQADGAEVLTEVRALKETMITEWNGTGNRGRIGISGYEMGYIPIGMTSEEMQIIETQYLDLRYFCNIFGVPSQLMNDPQNKTYNVQKDGEKALTSRCALPELNSRRDNLNRKGAKAWGMPKGMVCDYDISCYPELQADVKDTAEWTSKMIAISPNEQRELCGLAALPDAEMSEPWVITGQRMPLGDYAASIVDQTLNDGTEDDNTGDSAQ